ncbi:MAG: hypothetical protein QOH72_3953 [Solirubrobacteraceae bacterium]|nr:hypothetical protein [Solirubrobacteraceae bacterium]
MRRSATAAGFLLSAADDAQARLESVTLRWTAPDELSAAVRRVFDAAGVEAVIQQLTSAQALEV